MTPTLHMPTAPDIARYREGNTGVEGVWRFESDQPGRRVLVTALMHGNEFSGASTIAALLDAGLRPVRGALTLALCNLKAFDRFDAAMPHASRYVEEDMNRVWTDEALSMPTSSERLRALELLPFVRDADWLLDLHSMHEPSRPLLLSGPSPRHLELARRLGTPQHVVVDAGHADGCRLRDYGQFAPDGREGAMALLLEAGYHFDPAADAVALDAAARFLEVSGVIEPGRVPAAWRQPASRQRTLLQVTHAVVARSMNFRFAGEYTGLETFDRAGTVIGYDDDGPVRTPYEQCTLVMPSLRQLRPGVTVVRLARSSQLLPE